jgi:hypothetical protein
MSELSTDERAELEALRARVAALEAERLATIEATNKAVVAAQERAYWLDRWQLDLNALMRRRGAAEFRGAVRFVRELTRIVRRVKRKLLK